MGSIRQRAATPFEIFMTRWRWAALMSFVPNFRHEFFVERDTVPVLVMVRIESAPARTVSPNNADDLPAAYQTLRRI